MREGERGNEQETEMDTHGQNTNERSHMATKSRQREREGQRERCRWSDHVRGHGVCELYMHEYMILYSLCIFIYK